MIQNTLSRSAHVAAGCPNPAAQDQFFQAALNGALSNAQTAGECPDLGPDEPGIMTVIDTVTKGTIHLTGRAPKV